MFLKLNKFIAQFFKENLIIFFHHKSFYYSKISSSISFKRFWSIDDKFALSDNL